MKPLYKPRKPVLSLLSLLLVSAVYVLFGLQKAKAQVYFQDNFNGNTISSQWQVTNGGTGACQWMIHAPFTLAGTPITMLGSNFLWVDSDSAGSGTVANEIITSPVLTVPSGTPTFLEFSHFYRAGGIIRLDTGFVEVFNGSNWVRLAAYFTNVGAGNAPVSAKFNLTPFINPDLRFRFRYRGNWAFYWAIDNVKVSTPPANDLSATRIANTVSACGLGSNLAIRVRLANLGSQAQSNFPVSYQVNGGNPVTQNFTETLAPGDTAIFQFTTPFTPSTAGTYNIKAWTSLANDAEPSNDTTAVVSFTRQPINLATVTFNNFNGTNLSTVFPGWREATGLNPTGTTSGWANSATEQETSFQTRTAKINLFSNTKKDWIISPAANPLANSFLRFKVAVTNWNTPAADAMGSDDSLIVKVSTNCGQTWVNLRSYTAANQLTNQLVLQSIPMADFAGQTILIGFYATEGSVDDQNDYDVHIDDVELAAVSANDLSLQSILLPTGNCGVANPFQVQVRVLNNGTAAQSSIPLAYRLGNGQIVNQTFTQNLAPGQTADFTFSQSVNLPNPGSYSLKAWTALAGDANIENDSATAILKRPVSGFNPITFTGFTGSNLDVIYPGWNEATTINVTGTTSAWANSNATQTTFFNTTTAKINLFTNTKRDWIITEPVAPLANAVVAFKLAVTDFAGTVPDVMGSDDSLVVRVTTNCGQSWIRLRAFTAADQLTNTLTNFSVSLAAFAGQTIRIGFMATEGTLDNTQDYDLHLDDIQVYVPAENDLALESVVLPNSDCGPGTSFPVRVRVANNGSATQNVVPLFYSVNNQAPVSQTFNQTLTPGQNALFTFDTPISMPNAGTYTLRVWHSLSGDGNTQNDTLKNISLNRPASTFSSTINFTAFTGANLSTIYPGWREASGFGAIGTTSNWANSNATQTTGLGSATARVNLFTNTTRAWIISQPVALNPGFLLRFKVAITAFGGIAPATMGSDDSLIVRISTNCGQTWNRERIYTAASNLTNSLVQQDIPLGNYGGQNILIAFYASDGTIDNTQDYDLHIDDIQLVLPLANDVGVADIIFPQGNCGVPPSFPLTVRVTNFGSAPQSDIPLRYQINNGGTVEATLAGPVAPGATTLFTFPQNIDIPNLGVYTFSAWTALNGDLQVGNDSVKNKSVERPQGHLVQVDFNNFNGTNLPQVYNWYEAVGQLPVENEASTWVNSTGSQTTAFGSQTARINMNSNTKRHWMISNSFSPQAATNLMFKVGLTNRNFAQAAQMGSDDSVNVMISTNCGISWKLLRAFTVADALPNQLQEYSVSLSEYAGLVCRIGFFATEGTIDNPQDFDFHVDDVYASISTSQAPIFGAQAWNLYPNPASHRLQLTMPQDWKADRFEIWNLSGQRLMEQSAGSGRLTEEFDIQSLKSGLYILKVKAQDKVKSFTFSVMK